MIYIITVIILLIILYLLKNLNISSINKIEKTSIYECGFLEFEEPRRKYYIKFYILAIIFLIFDLETILVYPLSLNIIDINYNSFLYIIYFFIILSLGLAIEIYNKLIE
jgi:NADH:ubiquinone oxidoreductase subunit 3 (subunit A)